MNLQIFVQFLSYIKTCIHIDIKFDNPAAAYSSDNPRRSKIICFNFYFIRHRDIKAFLQESYILPCKYKVSYLLDNVYQHIVTGNLRTTENNKLRKLFIKSPKYKKRNDISWEKTTASIMYLP